jgi:hypothetical protein
MIVLPTSVVMCQQNFCLLRDFKQLLRVLTALHIARFRGHQKLMMGTYSRVAARIREMVIEFVPELRFLISITQNSAHSYQLAI